MRIIQLISQTQVGGAETFAYSLGGELTRRGHTVLLLANRANGPLLERPRPEGMEARALGRTSRLDPRIIPFLVGAIRQFRPDILHAHNFEPNTWARSLAFLFPRLRIVAHEHSGDKATQPSHRRWIDRLLFPRCSAVIAVSDELTELLHRRHHVPRQKLRGLPNGIDLAWYVAPRDRGRDPLEVVTVGRLSEVKNQAALLRAWPLVLRHQPDARLTLVGDGPLRPRLEATARESGIAESVTFAGFQDDVRPFLWRAAVFVLPSLHEAMPLSILEAMACGAACVGSRVGQIPAILEEGACGRLVAPDDLDGLAAGIVGLLERPAERDALTAAALQRVRGRYSLEFCTDAIEAVYREVLE